MLAVRQGQRRTGSRQLYRHREWVEHCYNKRSTFNVLSEIGKMRSGLLIEDRDEVAVAAFSGKISTSGSANSRGRVDHRPT